MPAGRPTKYTSEINDKLRDYIQECIDKSDIPFKEQFCVMNDISMDNYDDWCKAQSEFLLTNKKLENLQKFCLLKGSITNLYNPASAIFQLKANHGLIETSHTDITSGGQVIPILGNVSSNNGDQEAS